MLFPSSAGILGDSRMASDSLASGLRDFGERAFSILMGAQSAEAAPLDALMRTAQRVAKQPIPPELAKRVAEHYQVRDVMRQLEQANSTAGQWAKVSHFPMASLSEEERLLALRARGFDIERPFYATTRGYPTQFMGVPRLYTSPVLSDFSVFDTPTRAWVYGNLTPDELSHLYVYEDFMRDLRTESPKDYSTILSDLAEASPERRARVLDRGFSNTFRSYPVFTRPAPMRYTWGLEPDVGSFDDLISVYGLPGEEGYWGSY